MPDEASALFGDTLSHATLGDDTLSARFEPTMTLPVGLDTLHCVELNAPTDRLAVYTTGRAPASRGLQPEPRPELPGNDYGIMALLMVVIVLLALNCSHYATFFKTFVSDLLKVRERDNVFNDHTLSESRITLALLISLCVSEGILFFAALSSFGLELPLPLFASIAGLTVAAGIYYLWQVVAYAAVGYLFTAPWLSRQWLRGFNASQALLGLCLLLPAVGVLFRPELTAGFLILAATLYIIARIIFICKGFKIFYHNSFSLIYFILYLCTLEIAPLLLICRGVNFLSKLSNI